jgi:TolB-like protein/class 3 adenylate cyclase
MSVQTYFRICLFVPLLVPLPFLLFKGDEGLSALFIGSLVFGMPPYVLAFLLPLVFLIGRMTEKQIIIGVVFFPVLYALIFGLFWSIAPVFFDTNIKITLSNPSQWIFTVVVIPAAYSVVIIAGYIIRKLILKESDIHERILAAVLCADVKGYSQHMRQDEAGTVDRLNAYRQEFERFVLEHRGKLVHMAGDSIVVNFVNVFNAVDCAIKLQQFFKIKNESQPAEECLQYRIGINLGDVVTKGKDIHGSGVDIAARIERISEPGGICISGSVYDCIKNKQSFAYEYLGEKGMTNISNPLRVYNVLLETPEVPATGPEVRLTIPDKPSIAVLPFDNLSAYPEQEYFSDGIAGEILTDLSMLAGLFVISRHSTFVYKGKSVTAQQVSQDLGARFVLQGSARKAGNHLRITLQLIDVTTDKNLWTDRIDRELDDIFTITKEVSRKIVTTLDVSLTEQEQKRLGYQGTNNIEAHDLLIRGQEQYFTYTPKGIKKSITMFTQAIDLDPDYAIAYAWKSRVLIYQFIIGANNSKEETVEAAITLARKAIELYDLLPLAHACLGWALMWNNEIDEAIVESTKTFDLDPNFADGNMWHSMALSSAGKGVEAIKYIKIAIRMNPFHTVQYLFALGVAHFTQGQYETALSCFKQCNEHNPNYLPTHIFMTSCSGLIGKSVETETAKQKLLQLDPDCIFTGVSLQYIENFKQLAGGLIKAGIDPG